MSTGQMVDKEPIEEVLRFLADLMEKGTIHVDVFPILLTEAADEIDRLKAENAQLMSESRRATDG